MLGVGRGRSSLVKKTDECQPGNSGSEPFKLSSGRGILHHQATKDRSHGKKKVVYSICTRSNGDTYALIPEVNSDDENDIDNLMNDSDTEFQQTDDFQTREDNYLEHGLEAVIHSQIAHDESVLCMSWTKGYPDLVPKKACPFNGDVIHEYDMELER